MVTPQRVGPMFNTRLITSTKSPKCFYSCRRIKLVQVPMSIEVEMVLVKINQPLNVSIGLGDGEVVL